MLEIDFFFFNVQINRVRSEQSLDLILLLNYHSYEFYLNLPKYVLSHVKNEIHLDLWFGQL